MATAQEAIDKCVQRARAEGIGDVDGSSGSVAGVGSALRVVGGISSVDGARVFPESWCDELCGETLAVQLFADLLCFLGDLVGGQVVHVGHGVVVVELHGVEAELLVHAEFLGKGDGVSYGGAEGIGSFVDIPRPE